MPVQTKKAMPMMTAFAPRTPIRRPFWAGFFGLLGILLMLAFIDYTPLKNPYLSTDAASSGKMGRLGTQVTFSLLTWFGLASWFIPGGLFALGYFMIGKMGRVLNAKQIGGFLGLLCSVASLLALIEQYMFSKGFLAAYYPNFFVQGLGGFLGYLVFNGLLADNLGPLGSLVVLGFLFILSAYATFNGLAFLKSLSAWRLPRWQLPQPEPIPEPQTVKKINKNREPRIPVEAPAPALPVMAQPPVISTQPSPHLKIVVSEPTQKAIDLLPIQKGNYIFPTLDLLAEPPVAEHQAVEDHQQRAEALLKTLEEFGVKVNLGEIYTGPVITRYEVTPAPGVRVEKISALDKNIALGLRAISVRILAPVPGKGSVGIEIPNQFPSAVCIREIIESTAWAHANAEIPIVLGKDVTGRPIVADLTKMPHLLIAGSTGSGKTVCINAIIASLLYHASPEDLRFIMVDPKIVEMQLYNSLPHMLIPVVTNPKLVPGALKWLIREMERRYQIFAQVGVRNIAGFNAKILKDKAEEKKAKDMEAELSAEERAALNCIEVPRDLDIDMPNKKLPYIVCIIDELADLMMVAPADIETCVARLAQLARAAGIHLILATQRPSVNVITGVIKANLPARIAFKVASKVDSRTILDMGGADTLIGRGDMLFTPPGVGHLVRAQGAFVSDDEIHGIVEFLKRNGPPQFVEEIQQEVENSLDDGDSFPEEQSDELIPAALDVLRTTQRASTSILQRKLSIGYNRAARIMEILEARGIVGP